MANAVIMPDWGTSVDFVTLVKWLKQEGDDVKSGDLLCEIKTDKAAMQMEAFVEGVLLRQTVAEGSEIETGTVIAYVGLPGEEVPEPQQDIREKKTGRAVGTSGLARGRRAGKASPLVKSLARREGVDLGAVTGTGAGGKITREDVLAAKAAPSAGDGVSGRGVEPLSDNQRAVARQVTRSHGEIVPFDLVCPIRTTAADVLRERMEVELERPVGYDGVFIYVISRLLVDRPRFRSRFAGGGTVVSDKIDVGFLASFKEALYTPVVADADKKEPIEIEREVMHLAFRAARGKLSVDDSAGACFTVSNLSMYPIRTFNAIIPPGQGAALAVGGVEDVPACQDGKVAIVPTTSVTLTVDHRLINGRDAAKFLAELKKLVENL